MMIALASTDFGPVFIDRAELATGPDYDRFLREELGAWGHLARLGDWVSAACVADSILAYQRPSLAPEIRRAAGKPNAWDWL